MTTETKRGWPKGKPRGPMSPEHAGKFLAAGIRSQRLRALRGAEISSGRYMGGGLNMDADPRRAHLDVSPAVWRKATAYIGDYEYVEDGLDDVLLRALRERVVYAGSACCHHESPLQNITIEVIAATERRARKNGVPPRPLSKKKVPVKTKPAVVLGRRQREVVGLIAAGLTNEEAGVKLGIAPRTVKMHTDVLRLKLGVTRRRDIPLAFYELTGENVFADIPSVVASSPVGSIAIEAPREGTPLLEVVASMFDSRKEDS